MTYEGQAAIELEAAVRPGRARARTRCRGLDAREAVGGDRARRRRRRRAGRSWRRASTPAWRAATAEACAGRGAAAGVDLVVLSGGVFQNRLLLEATAARLAGAGLRVLVPERLPPNDGGIAFGQAAVAAACC